MKKIMEILTEYGIGFVPSDRLIHWELKIKIETEGRRLNKEVMKNRFFIHHLKYFDRLYIKNLELFMEKFDLKDKWKPEYFMLLEQAELQSYGPNPNFDIYSHRNRTLDEEWWRDSYWNNHPKLNETNKAILFERLCPGYLVQKAFHPEESKERLREALEKEGELIGNWIKEIPLDEIKEKIYVESVRMMKEAIEDSDYF